jgi:hypothetical protein
VLGFDPRAVYVGFVTDEVAVGHVFRALHSSPHKGELHNLYSSPYIIKQMKSRRIRWAGHVARTGEERNVNRFLVGNPERKRPLVRPRRRWEDGIKMDVREIGWGGCGVDSPGTG